MKVEIVEVKNPVAGTIGFVAADPAASPPDHGYVP